MSAAFEAARILPGFREHGSCRSDMCRFARMGRAGKRDFLVRQPISVRASALEKGQCLQGLHRRAREHRCVDVAERQHDRPFGVDDGDGAAMLGFDETTARGLEEDWIFHERRFRNGERSNARVRSACQRDGRPRLKTKGCVAPIALVKPWRYASGEI